MQHLGGGDGCWRRLCCLLSWLLSWPDQGLARFRLEVLDPAEQVGELLLCILQHTHDNFSSDCRGEKLSFRLLNKVISSS